MHPWEDWAETWAHYLHMVDTLETARSYGLALRPKPVGGAELLPVTTRRLDFDDFDDLITAWVPLTVALNSLNRSMGLADLYPFVLSDARPREAALRPRRRRRRDATAGAVAQRGAGARSREERRRGAGPRGAWGRGGGARLCPAIRVPGASLFCVETAWH